MNPLIGRGIGLLGALLVLIAVFVKLTDFGGSLWDNSDRVDIFVLLTAVAAGALILLNLATGTSLLLPVAAGLGLVDFGIFFPFVIEGGAAAIGAYLGMLGALLLVAGPLLSHLVGPPPVAVAPAAAPAVDPASAAPAAAAAPFSAAPAAAPAQAIQPEQPAAAATPAGWYPDPQGQARLRYWDGQAWTDHTSA